MKILLHRILTIATILTLVGCSNKNIENEQSEEYRNEVLDSDEDEVEYVNIDTAAYNAGMERLQEKSALITINATILKKSPMMIMMRHGVLHFPAKPN